MSSDFASCLTAFGKSEEFQTRGVCGVIAPPKEDENDEPRNI